MRKLSKRRLYERETDLVNYLVSALIALTSCAYIAGKPFWLVQLYVFKIGVLVIWLISLSISPMRRVRNVWFNVLVGYTLLQVILLQGQPQNMALEPLVNVFLGIKNPHWAGLFGGLCKVHLCVRVTLI